MSSVSGISSVSPFDVSSATQKAPSAKADTTTGSSSSNSGTTSSATSDSALTSSVGSTFMSLLVKELQNQDPTAPMDSTAMVGQMISLNQLDQLMSINEDLSGTSTGSTTSSTGSTTSSTSGDRIGTSSAAVVAARAAMANASSTLTDPTSAANASSVLNLSGLSTSNINGVN